MIATTTRINIQPLEDLEVYLESYVQIAEEEARNAFNAIAPNLLDELRYTPRRRRWTASDFVDEAERKAVMAKLNGQPYQRTGNYARGWQADLRQDGNDLRLSVSNSVPYAAKVGGSLSAANAGRYQHQGHIKTGWPRQYDTVNYWLSVFRAEFEVNMQRRLGDVAPALIYTRRARTRVARSP